MEGGIREQSFAGFLRLVLLFVLMKEKKNQELSSAFLTRAGRYPAVSVAGSTVSMSQS